jgi:hypothetical protein
VIEGRHFVLALTDYGEKLIVRALLYFVRGQGMNLQVLADHGVTRPVGGMAGSAAPLERFGGSVGFGEG